jgi:methylmalonyl-CoA carboxyltransferase small subunit
LKLRITIAGTTYEADVEVLEDDEAAAPYIPPPRPYIPPPQPGPALPQEFSDNVCRSPVTGLVIRIPVQEGQSVEAGDLLIVLEAMKMETQVTAPRAGSVSKIQVVQGNSVKANQPLIEMQWQEAPAGEAER